jgi:hypothetical protein
MSDVIYFIKVYREIVFERNFLCTAKILHMAPTVFVHFGRTVFAALSFSTFTRMTGEECSGVTSRQNNVQLSYTNVISSTYYILC